MTEQALGHDGRVVGRDAELRALEAFLSRSPPQALVLAGEPGVGKTTLWDAGLALARGRGSRVLAARPAGAETSLSSAGLIDLLDGVGDDELGRLPAPQRHALEVALFRAEPGGAPPDAHAICVALLGVLRDLVARQPLVLAVDDLQWLDAPSLDALTFAARRLADAPVVFLLARRPGAQTALERELAEKALERLDLPNLSLGATRRLLGERLGLNVSRNVLRKVFETTLGNPLLTLELGRAISARGLPAAGDDLPIPHEAETLIGARVAALPDGARTLLLALALHEDLRVQQAAPLAGPAALDDALEAGVIEVEGDRLRPAHPLLAAAAREQARPAERRRLHRGLAEATDEAELRALHLALATAVPDDELATTVADAAAAASARGAAQQAVALGEHALRLTAPGSAARNARLLSLAGYLEVAGARQRVTDLLVAELDALPPHDRSRAWLRLAEGGAIAGIPDSERYLGLALDASEPNTALRAHVLAKLSHLVAPSVARVREAENYALEALSLAHGEPELERLALHGLGWARALRGQSIDDVCSRFRAASDAATHITDSPEPVEGLRLVWRGHVREARVILTHFRDLADARGEEVSYALQRLNLCELELRAGEWEAAARLLDEWESADRQLLIRATFERSRALLAAGRGYAAEAERLAASALAGAEPGGYRWQVLEALRARGIAALLARDPERAAASLRIVWQHTEREGVDEAGAFPVAPDLVEALVELGEPDEAREVVARLALLSEEQAHPWGRLAVQRSGALLDPQADGEALAGVAEAYAELGLRFDCARSLLSLGRVRRRLRRWGAARDALEQATARFEELGSPGWAEVARSEQARVGGRPPRASGELTPAEQRVVELAADGLANKEIAQALVVSVRTVEVHLKHAYAKLGVRSRAQLARRLSKRA